MKLYEGMFIFSQTFVRENQQKAFDEIRSAIAKFRGKVVEIKVWAERSLAYEIKHVREAAYVLCYFEAPPDSIGKIERAVLISDDILRCLIINPEPEKPAAPKPPEDGVKGRTEQGEAVKA